MPVDGYLLNLRCLCGLRLFLGLISVVVGGVDLYLAWEALQWPNNTGVGIWAGVVSIITSVAGIIVSFTEPVATKIKCPLMLCNIFNAISYTTSILDIIWSALVVAFCIESTSWCMVDRPQKVALAAVDGTLGLVMLAIAVPISIFVHCANKKYCQTKITPY